MVAVRREEESFHITAEPLEEFNEGCLVRNARYAVLFRENCLGLDEIVSVSGSLEDEIKAMNRSTAGAKKFRDRIETFCQRRVVEMLEN